VSPGIDHLKDERLWSESVYLDCVSADARSGFVLRLCRYPTEATAWVWAQVFLGEAAYSYVDAYVPCGREVVAVEEADAVYTALDPTLATFRRLGPRDNPEGASASLTVPCHQGGGPPFGPGGTPVSIEASFRPLSASGSNVPRRSELLGLTDGIVRVGGRERRLRGGGQWHEQHQEAPRFRAPFTYLTLRGGDIALVGTRGPLRSAGYARRNGAIEGIGRLEIDAPATERRLWVALESGAALEGRLTTVHEYTTPIYDLRRPASLVTGEVEGSRVSGCVVDMLIPGWEPPAQPQAP
jgi:hypothetical protein